MKMRTTIIIIKARSRSRHHPIQTATNINFTVFLAFMATGGNVTHHYAIKHKCMYVQNVIHKNLKRDAQNRGF